MNSWKDRFPIFDSQPNLTYLDSAATTLKPQVVIDKIAEYYQDYSSNIHRGLYPIAEKASGEYESARQIVAKFINAEKPEEIIFTKGATEALNLLASSLSQNIIKPGVEVLTTIIEHHANFVPWQQVSLKSGAKFGVVAFHPFKSTKEEMLESFRLGITTETAILTLTHVSNVLGLVLPIKEIIALARSINPRIIIVVDACQSIQHFPIDVQELDVDFLVFSGHKIFGPTGVGVLYGRYEQLDKLPPYQFGGDMIEEVRIEATTFAKPPHRFEAGTPPIAEVIALGEAIKFVQEISLKSINQHSRALRRYALENLRDVFGSTVQLYTNDHAQFSGVISFNLAGCHPHDVAQIVGEQNVCIRVGHHCAQPLHTHLDLTATCRASLSVYNDETDIDTFVASLMNVIEVLHPHSK
ncbi:SufS family cysteine desulfurase [Candidatus Woesebacteria bacterium]|nr:SufS family cysteine desulfurase [Candidatus Woesebacteria bacterium]